jgi:hypothetical protein
LTVSAPRGAVILNAVVREDALGQRVRAVRAGVVTPSATAHRLG